MTILGRTDGVCAQVLCCRRLACLVPINSKWFRRFELKPIESVSTNASGLTRSRADSSDTWHITHAIPSAYVFEEADIFGFIVYRV